MTEYADLQDRLKTRLADLLERAEVIEDDLRHPLDADSSEQAKKLFARLWQVLRPAVFGRAAQPPRIWST